ncbi:MAG: hypothetical protein ACR2HM_10825 [Acidimicrobiales bacterium]
MTDTAGEPAWLQEAIAATSTTRRHDLREEGPADVLPGDVCIVAPFDRDGGVGRLFLVTEVTDGSCEGMLAGAETELATEVDAVLTAEDSGLGYEVAVHSRFHGPIWTTQIQRRVGAIEASVLNEIEKLAWNDEAEVSIRRGQPLQPDGIDPRFPALNALSAELDALTDHCRRRRHELTQPVLDPAIAEIDVLRTLLAERGWEAQVITALSSVGFRDRLLESLPQLSKDERRAVMPLIDRATVGPAFAAPGETSPDRLATHRNPMALVGAIAANASPAPLVRVLSHPRCGSTPRLVRVQITYREELIVFIPVSDVPLHEAA